MAESSSTSILWPTSTIDPGQSDGFFTTNDSPPLILVVLAIAGVIGVTFSLFGWRRIRMRSNGNGGVTDYGVGGTSATGYGSRQVDSPRPILSDFWTERERERLDHYSINDVGWEVITVCDPSNVPV
jgi:hypothetical protein